MYTRVREHAPQKLGGDAAPAYPEVLTALRKEGKAREEVLPPRRILVHMLVDLDYYFFKLAVGHERVYDMPNLTDEERAAEHGVSSRAAWSAYSTRTSRRSPTTSATFERTATRKTGSTR